MTIMRRSFAGLLLLALALTAPSTSGERVGRADAQPASSAATPSASISRTGTLAGSHYRIEVPANWRGGLVMYAHGIQRGPGPGAVTTPPLATHFLSDGHAYASAG